jgi:signal transduction protein with GAF and PtsI domain
MDDPLIKLHDLSNFLEHGSLDDNLLQLAECAAKILDAENCSIMLLSDGESDNLRLRVCANYGYLPDAAYKESIGKGEGIAGRVIASGRSILIEDITRSEFAARARRVDDPRKSLMSSPVTINRRIVGVVNISCHAQGGVFGGADLTLLEVVAMFIGKSIQVTQLQNILNSRFAQLALAQEAEKSLDGSLGAALQNPDQVAKILAKSFYKEMARAGFGSSQIINAASEIISQLSGSLQRHNKRISRGTAESSSSVPEDPPPLPGKVPGRR